VKPKVDAGGRLLLRSGPSCESARVGGVLITGTSRLDAPAE